MKRRPTDTSEAPARERRRLGRSLPVLAGAAIAAIGLTVGSLTAASAAAGHGGPGSIEQQAAKVKAEDAFTPKNGNAEMNVTVLEDQIKHYYGSASATFPVVGTVTVPSLDSNYAKQMQRIVANAEAYLAGAIHHQHGKGKPAVVFDLLGGNAGHQVKIPNPMCYISFMGSPVPFRGLCRCSRGTAHPGARSGHLIGGDRLASDSTGN